MKKLALFALLLSSLPVFAQEDVITRAMRDELHRSMDKLQMENMPRPYFISYKIVDVTQKSATATLGSLVASTELKSRRLTVIVHVGDYSSDNSHFLSLIQGSGIGVMLAGTSALPLDDDYQEVRRQIWIATDTAYKKALEDLAAKKADQQSHSDSEKIPDFTKAEATKTAEEAKLINLPLQQLESMAKRISSTFRHAAAIQSSQVQVQETNEVERFLNSEGSSYLRQIPEIALKASASTRSRDGMELRDSFAEYGRQLEDLPPRPAVQERVSSMIRELIALQHAAGERRYTGPVLFEKEAAAELFARYFAGHLCAQPRLKTNQAMLASMLGSQTPYLNHLGSRLLPDYLSLRDDPTQKEWEGQPLFGSYKVDEEGVPARSTVLIQDGILKTLLTSRSPVRGILQSSGNMRTNGVTPSNLILTATKTSTPEDLKTQLIDLLKKRNLEFGIIVHRMRGNAIVSAVRISQDGAETPMRNAVLSEFDYRSFKDIVAVSDSRTLYTAPSTARITNLFSGQGFDSEDVLVSYVVPSMLFEEVSFTRPNDPTYKPPIVSSPLKEEQKDKAQ